MSNSEDQTSSTTMTNQDRLMSKLDTLEQLLNQVSIMLDDLRDEIVSLDKKVDDNHDAIWSDMQDLKSDFKTDIKAIDDKFDDVDAGISNVQDIANDAIILHENNESKLDDLENKMKELEDNVSDVLLLKD